MQVQKAIDAGARIITQGNGSSVAAALTDWVAKHNERNPGKEVIYLNYAAVDPVLTNDKCTFCALPLGRQLRHQDGGADQVHEGPDQYQEDLSDQPGLFLRSVRPRGRRAMLKAKRPDIQIVGDELHPLFKVTDFAPYIAKIKASGADSVITGNWGQDFALLLKAAADAGLQVNWYTYYAGGAGGPTAIKQTGLNHRVFSIERRLRQRRSRRLPGDREGIPRQVSA